MQCLAGKSVCIQEHLFAYGSICLYIGVCKWETWRVPAKVTFSQGKKPHGPFANGTGSCLQMGGTCLQTEAVCAQTGGNIPNILELRELCDFVHVRVYVIGLLY